ncbi:hypothetical protein BS78_03G287300 [Paspalum vaginatum]|nr:hypothetical protein BS78_03G287300 [Paspalum vaginatum]
MYSISIVQYPVVVFCDFHDLDKILTYNMLCFHDCRTMPTDLVWEHGQKLGGGFKCKYCKWEKSGGGATRFKEHLAVRVDFGVWT